MITFEFQSTLKSSVIMTFMLLYWNCKIVFFFWLEINFWNLFPLVKHFTDRDTCLLFDTAVTLMHCFIFSLTVKFYICENISSWESTRLQETKYFKWMTHETAIYFFWDSLHAGHVRIRFLPGCKSFSLQWHWLLQTNACIPGPLCSQR